MIERVINPVNFLSYSRLRDSLSLLSSAQVWGDYSISKSVFGKHSRIFIIAAVTRISVYLKSIRTSKYVLFEIKILRNSDFVSCAKVSVSKITSYTVLVYTQNSVQLL